MPRSFISLKELEEPIENYCFNNRLLKIVASYFKLSSAAISKASFTRECVMVSDECSM